MEKTVLKIKLYSDPVLRKKAYLVKEITSEQRDILSKMAQLMYENSGIGLAAPQVGINASMIVVDISTGLYKLINPKIIKREGSQAIEEGCLSVPGVCIKVKRAKKILVQAQDEFAKPVTIEAEGLLASVFQHEIDHLRGRLIVDYASFFQRLKIRKKLEELSRQATEIKGGIPPSPPDVLAGKKKAKNEELPESETKSCQLQL
jgi:peptide deformylase